MLLDTFKMIKLFLKNFKAEKIGWLNYDTVNTQSHLIQFHFFPLSL